MGKEDDNKDKMEKAKNVRRAAKSALTRTIRSARILIDVKRPPKEVLEALKDVEKAHVNLVAKHEDFTMFLNDEEYDEADIWMADCTDEFTRCGIEVMQYVESVKKDNSDAVTVTETAKQTEGNSQGQDNGTEQEKNGTEIHEEENSSVQASKKTNKPLVLKHEKPKLPSFYGDVRKYFIFKEDFKHAVETHCNERDAITILRSCLGPEPGKLIEGLCSDLEVAWKYLDQNYGDPRIVSDTVIADLESFKAIPLGDDHRFCDLVNLVRRSYNILKEVKRPQDIDNTHVISLIERKMTRDDLRVWARHINLQKLEPSMSNLLSWMEEEMSARLRSGAAIRKSGSTPRVNLAMSDNPVGGVNSGLNRNSHDDGKLRQIQCYVCKGKHYVDQCSRFLAMVPQERWKVVKEQRACFSCLKRSKGHSSSNCHHRGECKEKLPDGNTCKRPHHKLLHYYADCSNSPVQVSFVQDKGQAILPTMTGYIKDNKGGLVEANVFYDSGAQVSMIRSAYAEKLGLDGKPVKIVITKVGGAEEELDTKLYKVPVCKGGGQFVQTIQAIGILQISEETSEIDVSKMANFFNLSDRELQRKSGPVDLLVGVNYPRFHVGETKIKDGLVARKSPLGWVLFGNKSKDALPEVKKILHVRLAAPIDLTDFWKTESMGVAVSPCTCEELKMSQEERYELKVIEDSCKLQEKRWTMKYPWKRDPAELPDNYSQVLKKLESTERRLLKNPEYADKYNQQIKEMEELNFAKKLTKTEINEWKGPVHYVAHHAVVRPEKKTTPIRIVFNSSASYNGHTLNDYWFKGPDLLNNLFGVLLRFRENQIAVCGDITKMYHMICIPPEDQHVHRFIWRNYEIEREPDVYVKTVLTFGDRPAPAMAITAMRKTAEINKASKSEAAESIIKNAYVDDICDSVGSIKEAEALISDIDDVLASGGFHVKKWVSNRPISADEDTEEVVLGGETHTEKVLGTVWLPKEDKFSFKIKNEFTAELAPTSNPNSSMALKLTKRLILSKLAKIFDPMGAGAAVLIKAKIAMQELWQLGLSWDDEVPPEATKNWIVLFQEMNELNNVKFERCLTPSEVIGDPLLVVFCDASRLAFGACAYARWMLKDGTFSSRFIAAKSRVAPLKELSIPRLELQGAVLASRLGKSILEESRLHFEGARYLTDSLVTLAWIQGNTRSYKPFVSARVGEIQSNSKPADWLYCPTDENVADDVTKGISAGEVNGRWFKGPEFLQRPEEFWPKERGTADVKEVNKERRKVNMVCPVTLKQPILNCENFSKWRRLLRVTAYVLRFCHNLRVKSSRLTLDSQEPKLGPLSAEEVEESEEYWLKFAQQDLSKGRERGDFKTLSIFDDKGIIRVGGRADPCLVSYANTRPALLPYKHWISTLVTREAHQSGHPGVATTTAKTRRKYWVIKGHNLAKVVKRHCTFCREMEAKVETQLMADLPVYRQQPHTPPFLYTACDYFGPMKVKIGRNKITKHYGVIFTCLNSRAVHCELATDASTMEFLQVLRRFFSYRGYPKMILSDNGSQMVGAERELRAMLDGWDKDRLREYCAERGLKWKFTTPLAPHQNGCTEAMVKSTKSALKKAIGEATLTPFELYTCLLEAANLLNQRPIGRIPEDPDDGSYLCPNDILLGRATNTVPQGPFRHTLNPRHRFEFCQRIIDSFWKKWSRDVLPHLLPRKKWNVRTRNVQVGDFVVVADPNAVRGKWQTGRVVEAYQGEDGLTRNVKVKTATGTYARPITKICVIYPVEGFEENGE